MKIMLSLAIGVAAGLWLAQSAQARGGGGAGGYHGGASSGGYHGESSGGYHGESSGYHAEGSSGAYHGESSGYHAEGSTGAYHGEASASGYHADSYSGYHGATAYGQAAHVGLPTDGGLAAHPNAGAATGAGAAGYAAAHSATQSLSSSHVAAQGAAVRNAYSGAGTFNHNWYGDHPGAWAAAGWDHGAAWGVAAWGTTAAAIGLAADAQPIAYSYGNNITYQGNQVFYGDNPVASSDQYYQQAATLAQNGPATDAQSPDWMPLGVFALVQNDQDSPQFVLQLAINKSGAIAGNYEDLVSDTVQPVHGGVDAKTQRVAFTIGNSKKNIGDTGLYNLTQDEAPVLIHRGSAQTQQWLLVRLKQPDQQPAAP